MSTADGLATRQAAAVWYHRGLAEMEASARFDRLAGELATQSAAPLVIDLARRAASDESRHAVLCAELSERFGGRRPSLSPRTAAPIGVSGCTPRERVLFEVIATCCVMETLSAAVLGSLRAAASDPRVRAVAHEILLDEVLHSRMGWAHLAAERERGPARFVADALPAMLQATAGDTLLTAEDDDVELAAALAGRGSLPLSERRTLFTRTLREVVFPGLRRADIDTAAGERWLTRSFDDVSQDLRVAAAS